MAGKGSVATGSSRNPADGNLFAESDRFAIRFILVSLIYLIAGITWMGPLSLLIPGPAGMAANIYDSGRFHVLFVGFIGFVILAMLYYVVPRLSGKQLHSMKLGSIHFWLSNILLPIAIILEVAVSVVYQDLINAPNFSVSSLPPFFLGLFVFVLIVFFIAIAAQVIFAYNIYRTIR